MNKGSHFEGAARTSTDRCRAPGSRPEQGAPSPPDLWTYGRGLGRTLTAGQASGALGVQWQSAGVRCQRDAGSKCWPLPLQHTVRSPSPPRLCLILRRLLHASSSRKASQALFPPPEASGLAGSSSVLHLGGLCRQLPPLPVPQAPHTAGAPGGHGSTPASIDNRL